MKTIAASLLPPGLRIRTKRGSVLIVALLLASIISVSLVSYIKLCTTSLKLAHRTLLASTAGNLAEIGLEDAIWSFNQMGAGSATAWNTWGTPVTTKVAAANVTRGGSGYTAAPTVTFNGGGGNGATATAIITNGAVTDIQISNGGSGYTAAPTVAFSGGYGNGATAVATHTSITRPEQTFALDQNATGRVKVYVAGHDGSYSSPVIVAKATITPYDGGAPIIRIVKVTMRFNGPFVNGVVAKNGLTWNGQPMADSWISNPTNSPTGPWVNYTVAGARANNTVADLTGTVELGAQGVVNGTLSMGATVTKSNKGTVNGTTNYNFSYQFNMPAYPTTASLDNYYNVGATVPATLPRVLDNPNTTDGRYYYFAVGASFGTTVVAGKNVTIVGSGTTNVSGTVNIPSTSTLKVYTDGTINGTFVNNAWAGALQLYTTTTAGTTINGNQNIKACIFAPNSPITGNGGGNTGAFFGSFIGATVTSNGHMDFHYDESLGRIASAKPWSLTIWRELQTTAERAIYAAQLNY